MALRRTIPLLFILMLCGLNTGRSQSLRGNEALYFDERPRSTAEMGIVVGGVYMGMTNSEAVSFNPKMGVRGALSMSLCWDRNYALQMELAYIYNKIDADKNGGATFDVRSNVMEIPVMFSFRGLWPLRFNVGPVLSLAGTGRYDSGEERIEFGRLRSTLGYTAGVAVSLSRHLLLDGRFTGSFGRMDNYFEGAEFTTRSWWASLSIGYVF